MCDLKREIGLWLSGRILGVHPFATPNNALASGREQIGVNGERTKTRAAINDSAMNPLLAHYTAGNPDRISPLR